MKRPSDTSQRINRFVFINLKRRTDRLTHVRRLIEALQIQDRAVIIEAVDGVDINAQYLRDHGYATYASWRLDSAEQAVAKLSPQFTAHAVPLLTRFWKRE